MDAKRWLTIGLTLLISSSLSPCAFAGAGQGELSSTQMNARLLHAKELLGKYYDRSIVKVGERVSEVEPFVRELAGQSLPRKWQKRCKAIADTIVRESRKHGFDPLFLVAVIKTESGFNPTAVGTSGEVGLMQLRPATARWIAKKFGIAYRGKKSLYDPISNIRLGAAFLSQLREEFDSHSRLYLSAYNMGAANVERALDHEVWPKVYAGRVMKHYIGLYTRLSRDPRYAALAKVTAPLLAEADTDP